MLRQGPSQNDGEIHSLSVKCSSSKAVDADLIYLISFSLYADEDVMKVGRLEDGCGGAKRWVRRGRCEEVDARRSDSEQRCDSGSINRRA